jgi:hypothetical protein
MTENEQIEEQMDNLLIEFDEMGFQPTTPVPDPEGFALNWRNRLLNALKGYRKVESGEWIAKPQEFYIDTTDWMCSVCKEEFSPIDMVQDEFFRMMKFCPNCGADMRKEQ